MITISIITKNDRKWKEFEEFFQNYPYILKRNLENADYVLKETTYLNYDK